MKIDDLKPNIKNPRKISAKQKAGLKKSIEEFGDLGGIVFNEETNSLVGGHQRKNALKGAEIKIINKYDPPTKTGTVADGFAIIGGEKFSYRVVRWNKNREMEALLAANKHGGVFDADLMKVISADFKDLDFGLAGFEVADLKNFGISINIETPKISTKVQEQTDEQYVASTENVNEQIDVENPNMNVEMPKEKAMDVVGKRFVIIIDCTSADHKAALKEKIEPLVKEAGGKFF